MGEPGEADLPPHVEEAREAIARLHLRHHAAATRSERLSQRVAQALAGANFLAGLAAGLCLWVLANVLGHLIGWPPFDPWPFQGLQAVAAVAALFMTVMIFTAQRRDDELSELRERVTLELVLLSGRRNAKLVELLEELRNDLPNVPDRRDEEAEILATALRPEAAVDPTTVNNR